MWRLVQQSPPLDGNSPYAYLLLCTDFAGTGAIAEGPAGIAGFVLGYRPPARPEACFVWQVGVADDQRGRGLGRALLERVVERNRADGVRFVEATVTPSNHASWALFKSFAQRAGVALREEPAFPSDLFPGARHEEEVRVRIGPLDRRDRDAKED